MTVSYQASELGPVKEPTLGIYSWDGSTWQRASSDPPDLVGQTLTARPTHFSYWAVLGEMEQVFLPLVLR